MWLWEAGRISERTAYWRGVWERNGGNDTIVSYHADLHQLSSHLDWLESLPLYIDFGDRADGTLGLFVSHTGIKDVSGVKGENLYAATNMISTPVDDNILWYRDTPARIPQRFHVFGHTPVSKVKITDYYANIDSGIYRKYKGEEFDSGHLTGLRWPSLETVRQINIG